jgi:hypothetical protein
VMILRLESDTGTLRPRKFAEQTGISEAGVERITILTVPVPRGCLGGNRGGLALTDSGSRNRLRSPSGRGRNSQSWGRRSRRREKVAREENQNYKE